MTRTRCVHTRSQPGITSMHFRTFICEELDDGMWIMREDPTVDCTTSTYRNMQAISAFGILVYIIGVPLMYVVIVRRYQPQLKIVQRLQTFIETRTSAEAFSADAETKRAEQAEMALMTGEEAQQRRAGACSTNRTQDFSNGCYRLPAKLRCSECEGPSVRPLHMQASPSPASRRTT